MNTNNTNFDLNIKNYNRKELEELLELPTNYDESIIDMKATKLRQNILNNPDIEQKTKSKTISFIGEVRNFLMKKNDIYNLDKSLKKSETVSAGNTQIIKRTEKPYANSMPSEYYQGIINPLNKRVLRQNINIDTRFRDNYFTTSASNFHLDMPIKISKVVSMQLSALEFPSTFYAISKALGNNFFVIEIDGEPPLIVTIPDGNYTFTVLQNYLAAFMTSSVVPALYQNIVFIIDAISVNNVTSGTGHMVTNSGASGIKYKLNFGTDMEGNPDTITPIQLKFGWMMGFRKALYEGETGYVSEGIVDLVGPRYLYLVVNDFNNNVSDAFYGAFKDSILNKNILARITIQGSVFNILTQNNFSLITSPRQYFGPVDVQKLHIQLLNEYGKVINLNSMDYSFCITFQTIYDL
jgi:hypothetical protein